MLSRFYASKTKKVAKRDLILNSPLAVIFVSFNSFSGLTLGATYSKCDPLTSKAISYPIVEYFKL
jgi:hypothetical protein